MPNPIRNRGVSTTKLAKVRQKETPVPPSGIIEGLEPAVERAKEIIEDLGYDEMPGDSAYGFTYEGDRRELAPIAFRYRQSPSAFIPQLFAGSFAAEGNGTVSADDPPPMPGEISVRLDPQGRLVELSVFPSSLDENESFTVASDKPQVASSSWSIDLYRAAGLIDADDAQIDVEKFSPSLVARPAPAGHDVMEAWQGRYPGSDVPVAVEAAASAGKPVYFRVSPIDKQEGQRGQVGKPSAVRAYAKIIVFLLLMIAGGLLARHNLRRGRGDRKGALRLTWYVLTVYAVYWVLHAGRAAKPPPWPVFIMGMEMALTVALILTIGVGHPYVSWFVGGLTSLLVVVLFVRFGLLAVVSFMFVRLLLTYPITANLSAWHATSTTLLPLGVIVALAGYGFYVSLAGRPLIRDAIV